MPELSLVATCALGLEEVLAGELRELGVEPSVARGAVTYTGAWETVWQTNLRLRTANRVLIELASWPAPDEEALAAGVHRLMMLKSARADLRLAQLLVPERTLAVRATSSRSRLRDTRWIALKVKDALVDSQRELYGRRSSVDRRRPAVPLRAWLHDDHVTLLLDTSREPLDHRGYRVETTAAPVREQLAAACILASGWDRSGPVVDPMCGSGTLLIEAGWLALGRMPGALRQRWVFERLRRKATPRSDHAVELIGVDQSPQAAGAASRNLVAAGLRDHAKVHRGDAFAFSPPDEPGLVAVNPPYDRRAAADPAQWRRLGDLLKQRYRGWKAVVLAGDSTRGKHIGLRPLRRIPVRNGPIDARILLFDLY